MKEIEILKKYISESKDLSEPVNYFFDMMDQDKILYGMAHRKVEKMDSHPDLRAAIVATINIASNFLNKPINISGHQFYEIVQEKFYHGSCMVSGHTIPLLVLYCADIQVGISALTSSSGNTNFFRFALAKSEDFRNKH